MPGGPSRSLPNSGRVSSVFKQPAAAWTELQFVLTRKGSAVCTKLLDPTLDVVFKLLLQRNPALLRDMIEAVVVLDAPIRELVVLNPEIPPDVPADKSVVLDIRVRLDNGYEIDLEMQS